jgi:peptidoglycan-associated lipoprotein
MRAVQRLAGKRRVLNNLFLSFLSRDLFFEDVVVSRFDVSRGPVLRPEPITFLRQESSMKNTTSGANIVRPYPLMALAALALVAAGLAGCDTPTKLNNPDSLAPVESRNTTGTGAATGGAATTAVAPQSAVPTVDLTKAASGGAAGAMANTARVVYFDYDSYAIRDDFKSVIDSHAKVLSANKGKRIVIEGHTDQRGGREYNLALGQKRAVAVLSSLTLLGASESQMEAVSFGQERPAVQGSDESAWSKNRRAELKDR